MSAGDRVDFYTEHYVSWSAFAEASSVDQIAEIIKEMKRVVTEDLANQMLSLGCSEDGEVTLAWYPLGYGYSSGDRRCLAVSAWQSATESEETATLVEATEAWREDQNAMTRAKRHSGTCGVDQD